MININKNTLCVLAMIAAPWNTISAASVEIIFTNGAEMQAPITGGANFNGAGNCNFSGSATGPVTLTSGNVQVDSAAPFGGSAIFEGGSLEATAAMDLPPLVMNAAGTVTADANLNVAHPVSGSNKLTLAGVGQFTPTTDLSAGGVNNAAVDFTGTGGLNITSVANKLPTGPVTIYSASQMVIAPGLEVGHNDVVAAGNLILQSGSTTTLGNGATLNRPIVIGVSG